MSNEKITTLHLGANLGNLLTKMVGDVKKDMYMSSVETMLSEGDASLMKNDDHLIKVNGTYYLCGENDVTADDIDRRPIETLHVLTCFGIARQLVSKKSNFTRTGNFRFNKCDVNIVLGLCIDEYKVKTNIDMLYDEFDNKTFDIEYMGIKFKAVLNLIDVLPEGFCHYQVNYEEYANYRSIFLIDCGSKTWDMCKIINGRVRQPDSKDYGTLDVMKDIIKVITNENPKTKVNLTDVELMLRNGSVSVGKQTFNREDFKELIDTKSHTSLTLVNNLYKHEVESSNLIIGFGGGINLVKDSLHNMFGEMTEIKILENPEYTNAQAYYEASFQDEE